MKNIGLLFAALIAGSAAHAENLQNVDRMICGSGQVQICLETGDCYQATPWELNIPDFVVIDLRKKTVATTRGSGLNRSTGFSRIEKTDGLIYLQGIEGGRGFSFIINEPTGRMTAAMALDGIAITVFGACTDADQ